MKNEIDVSECEHFNVFINHDNEGEPVEYCEIDERRCTKNETCYYKQLRAKEAEFKEYKTSKQNSFINEQERRKAAETECKELKALLKDEEDIKRELIFKLQKYKEALKKIATFYEQDITRKGLIYRYVVSELQRIANQVLGAEDV